MVTKTDFQDRMILLHLISFQEVMLSFKKVIFLLYKNIPKTIQELKSENRCVIGEFYVEMCEWVMAKFTYS